MGSKPLDIKFGGMALTLFNTLNQTDALSLIQFSQQLHSIDLAACGVTGGYVSGMKKRWLSHQRLP